MMVQVKASLIVPSIHRTAQVIRLLESLCHQSCMDFEVILVDQNSDDRLVPVVKQLEGQFPIQHVRSKTVGASRARNAGFSHSSGELILWPDDDSWLPSNFIAETISFFNRHPDIGGAVGILVDEHNAPHARWLPKADQQVTFMDAFTRAAEPVLFFRREILQSLGGFDETIGTGSQTPWGAGEGTDLCVRALKASFSLKLAPQLMVYHKRTEIHPENKEQLAKARSYARGMGAVVRKNDLPVFFKLKYLATYLRALVWNGLKGKWDHVQYHWTRLIGVIEGLGLT